MQRCVAAIDARIVQLTDGNDSCTLVATMKTLLRRWLGVETLERELRELPTKADLVRQKASYAGFLADFEGMCDRVTTALKRMSARAAKNADRVGGQTWEDEPAGDSEDLSQFDLSLTAFKRDREGP